MKLGVWKKKFKITAGRTVFRKSTPNLTITNGDFESNFEVLKKKNQKASKSAYSIRRFFFREKKTEGQGKWTSTKKKPDEKKKRRTELSLSWTQCNFLHKKHKKNFY